MFPELYFKKMVGKRYSSQKVYIPTLVWSSFSLDYLKHYLISPRIGKKDT
jgi:hypothetical protein